MREGLYSMNFHTVHGIGTGVVYAINGKLRGGNSAFFFLGSYSTKGDKISIKLSTYRYNNDPKFVPLYGVDMVTLGLTGMADGDIIDFEGNALQLPGINFKALFTRIGD